MSTIITRAGKGSRLTWAEVDANFNNLNSTKAETSAITAMARAALSGAGTVTYDSVTGIITGTGGGGGGGGSGGIGVNLADFGYVGNGTTDETSVMANAIAFAYSSGQRVVYVPGGTLLFDPTAVGINNANPLTIYVHGTLKPTTTITLPGDTHIIGVGGATHNQMVQFNYSDCCDIIAPSGNIPVIKITGNRGTLIRNVNIHNCYTGILIDGANQLVGGVKLKKIGINTSTASTSTCLLIDAAFWIFIDDSSFIGTTNADSCIRITNSINGAPSAGGLVFLKDCITAGPPIKVNPDFGVCGSIYIRDHHHESQQTGKPVFYFGGAGTSTNNVGVVTIDGFGNSDPQASAGPIFDCPGMKWRECMLTLSNIQSVIGFTNKPFTVNYNGASSNFTYQKTPQDFCIDSINKTVSTFGDSDTRMLSRGSAAGGRVLGSGVHVALAPTTNGLFTVSSGQRAPDGSTTAYLCTVPGGADSDHTTYSTQPYNQLADIDGGDIVVTGGWFKDAQGLDLSGQGAGSFFNTSLGGNVGLTFDSPSGESSTFLHVAGFAHRWKNNGWAPYYMVGSVSGTRTGQPALIVGLNAQSNRSFYIWQPFVRVIKVADGYTKSDIIRYMNSIDVIPQGPQGSISMHAHQAIRTGRNTTANRPSAVTAGNGAMFYDTTLSAPVWSDGTNWKDSTGNRGFPVLKNYMFNPKFQFWNRGTDTGVTQLTGRVRLADMWSAETIGSTCRIVRVTNTIGQVTGEPQYYHRVNVVSVAGNGNYVRLMQRIPGVRTLAGQAATLSFYSKYDTTGVVAVELVQCFGTGGTPSADVTGIGVTKFNTTASFQATAFSTSFTIPSISGKTLGTNNDDYLQVNFWVDAGSDFDSRTSTVGQHSGNFDFNEVQLEAGSGATTFEYRPDSLERSLISPYFHKSFLSTTAPAQNVGVNTGEFTFTAPAAGAVTENSPRVFFNTTMRSTAPTITLYSPAATSAQARDETASANCTSTSAVNVTDKGFAIQCTGASGTAVGNILGVHWTAEDPVF